MADRYVELGSPRALQLPDTLSAGLRGYSRDSISIDLEFEDQIIFSLFPLRGNLEAIVVVSLRDLGDGTSAAKLADKRTNQRSPPRLFDFQPRRVLTVGVLDDQVPASDNRVLGLGGLRPYR